MIILNLDAIDSLRLILMISIFKPFFVLFIHINKIKFVTACFYKLILMISVFVTAFFLFLDINKIKFVINCFYKFILM